jgi:hypothetical protein
MEPIEVQLDIGVFTFDGHVLELFVTGSERFHVRLLTVTISRPDKKGTRRVTLAQVGAQSVLPLDEAEFEGLQPIFEALQGAGVKVVEED